MGLKYLKNVVTLELNSDLCKGCGRCLEVCPHHVFELRSGQAAVRERDACMECGACARNCPFKAIKVQPGVGCAAAVLSSRKRGGSPDCGCGESGGCCG